MFLLKRAVREELGDAAGGCRRARRARPSSSAGIDRLALMAFDVFMRCREQIYELRARRDPAAHVAAASAAWREKRRRAGGGRAEAIDGKDPTKGGSGA